MALPPEIPQLQRLSQAEQRRLGLPDGYKIYSPFPFAAINQKDSKYAIDDKEFIWLENILRQGAGFLRAAPDRGAAIYTAGGGKVIVSMFFYNIGTVDYCAVFLNDGTAVQVRMSDHATTPISSTPNTFYHGGSLPACVQWGNKYLVIANNNTVNDYWIWDGAILYTSGTLGPQVVITSGGVYTSAPTVTFVGGSGSGATGTATVVNGAVTQVIVTNPGTGYQPGDIVQLAFSGGGSDTSAQLVAVLTSGTVDHIRVTNPGTGYTSRPAIGFTGGGGGSGATAHSVLTGTSVASVTVGAGGAGYTFANVIFSGGGGGTGAAATAVITAGAITAITMTNFGSGYTDVPSVAITGDGAGATATANLTATTIAAVVMDTHGTGYTSTPGVTFTGGGGSSASALAELSSNSVASVTINNGGSGFKTTPLLTFEGGGGTGATATVVVTAGVITAVTVTNGGTGYTSTPTVVVEGGTNNSAAGFATLMPFGVSGNALETFQSRVWIFHPTTLSGVDQGGVFQVSSPGSLTDFSIFDGGVVFSSSDSSLRKKYTNAKASNGYLYIYGDSSCIVVSNVQTSGNPPITTFNYQVSDPQVGTSFRDTIQVMSRAVISANMNGIFALYGGADTRVSEKVDNIFDTAQFPPTGASLLPSSAVCYIHNVLYYMLLLTITDPFTEQARNVLLMWDERGFYVGTQTASLTYIAMQEVDSDINAYGTDGSSLFQLFTTPSTNLQKVLVTKQYGGQAHFLVKQSYNFTVQGEDFSGNGAEVSIVINSETGNFAVPGTADLADPKVFTGPTEDAVGAFIGLTIASTAEDFAIYNLSIGYADYVGPIGSGSLNAPKGT